MDERNFRNAMGKFATGITVVSMKYGNQIIAMTVNAFMSVSLSPKLIAISINQQASMHNKFASGKPIGISILTREQESLSSYLAKQLEEIEEIEFVNLNETPVLKGATAILACKIVDSIRAGDHTIFIAEVTEFAVSDEEPVIFYNGKYRKLVEEK
ncbi:flavin reductase family protein [Ornithinibacillus californiensis]|uniref:flavin reductase family protein n=1 Tax=Ornithinibacillus californiensis TaxID=161536 RepID=UPI00064DB6FD|nr:flavin reductase family protein [Ornithinibacillus californiensis]